MFEKNEFNMESYLNSFEEMQRAYCEGHGYELMVTSSDLKVGVALTTLGALPINGLRHPSEADTSGWYVWYGKELSSELDSFSAVHATHLTELCPEIIYLLGLPPGYRFLKAGEYIDVWYDSSLLNI